MGETRTFRRIDILPRHRSMMPTAPAHDALPITADAETDAEHAPARNGTTPLSCTRPTVVASRRCRSLTTPELAELPSRDAR